MADIFISYARSDAERVRLLATSLHADGLAVWCDPSEPLEAKDAPLDAKLSAAPAVLVIWSSASRSADHVLMEAITAMGSRKLVQLRLDDQPAPPPFDRLSCLDFSSWSGDPGAPAWGALRTALLEMIAERAGDNGHGAPKPKRLADRPSYLETRRVPAVGPLLAAASALAIFVSASVWTLGPSDWRKAAQDAVARILDARSEDVVAAAPLAVGAPPAAETKLSEETLRQAEAALTAADLTDVGDLGRLLERFPGTPTAETALALLRAMDARSWGEAVARDTESAYNGYLNAFPEDGPAPGQRIADARERLASIGVERSQAIADIQRALSDAKLYQGPADGKAGARVKRALQDLSRQKAIASPDLASASPRQLRALSDVIRSIAESGQVLSQAPPGAGRAADAAAWIKAAETDAVASYEAYLAVYPAGAYASKAREALGRLTRLEPFSIYATWSPELRRAVLEARTFGAQALQRAEAARARASAADAPRSDAGTQEELGGHLIIGGDGPPGRYRGEISGERAEGLGVLEYPAAATAGAGGALRYEGEHTAGDVRGLGVTYWRNGDTLAGVYGPDMTVSGVLQFANGQRYEGGIRQGRRSGYGVVWTSSGEPVAAGRWTDDRLITPGDRGSSGQP
jgi:hypothetical protein